MPFNEDGKFVRTDNWAQDAAADIKIITSHHDREDDNFADGLSQCVTRDGKGKFGANVNFNNYKGINVRDGVFVTDAVNAGQLLQGVDFYVDQSVTQNKIYIETAPYTDKILNGAKFNIKIANVNNSGDVFIRVNDILVNGSLDIPVVGIDGLKIAQDSFSANSVRTFVFYNEQFRLMQGLPSNGLPLLSWFMTDAKYDPNIIGYLGFREQGAICDGDIYVDAYNKLKSEYNNNYSTISITIRGVSYACRINTVTRRLFFTETVYQQIYTAFGACPGYVLDSNANGAPVHNFRLPINVNFFRGDKSKGIFFGDDQIVNITGKVSADQAETGSWEGAFANGGDAGDGGASGGGHVRLLDFNASRVVRTGDQVQPRYISQFVYYVVGNQIINEGKVDLTTITDVVSAIADQAQTAASTATQAANTAQTAATTAVDAVSSVGTAVTEAISTVQAAAGTAISEAQAAASDVQTAAESAKNQISAYVDAQDMGGYTGYFSDFINYGRYRGTGRPADAPYIIQLGEHRSWLLEVLPYYTSTPSSDGEKVDLIQKLTVFNLGLNAGEIVGKWQRNFCKYYQPSTGTQYYFTGWNADISMSDVNNAVNNAVDPLIAQISALQNKVNALGGLGGSLDGFDFGDAPTQAALTEYAMRDIFGAGGDFTYNGDDPAQSTYVINGITHIAAGIFNSTWVRNSYDGHRHVLTNTPDTDPAVFWWADVGLDVFDENMFVKRSSSQTQVIEGDIALTGALYGKTGTNKFIHIAHAETFAPSGGNARNTVHIGDANATLEIETKNRINCKINEVEKDLFARTTVVDDTSDEPELSPSGGCTYKFSVHLASLTLLTIPADDNETKIYFTADSNFVLILPQNFDFETQALFEEMPNFETGRQYMISIDNGIVAVSQRG
jgi:hypothetical protein